MTNMAKIKGAIASAGLTQAELAAKLKISEATLSMKLNGKREFKASEMLNMKNILKLERLDEYFFVGL